MSPESPVRQANPEEPETTDADAATPWEVADADDSQPADDPQPADDSQPADDPQPADDSQPAVAVAPGRPRDQNRERAILEAALALVTEVGYDRLTMDAVAARAKASKATIYRRWAGKKELIVEAITCQSGTLPEPEDTGSLRGDLLWHAEAATSSLKGIDGRLILGVAQAALSDPGLRVALSEHDSAYKIRAATTIVERAVARRELSPEADPALLIEIAPAVLLMRLVNGQGIDHAFLEHLVEDILLPVLRHPPTFPQPLIPDDPGDR